MEKSKSTNQEAVDNRLIEGIYELNITSLGEGAATRQVSNHSLHEGVSIVLCVFRPPGEVVFQIGYVVCGDEAHDLPEEYTWGVCEFVVEGRLGWCSDGSTQSAWPVLLEPEVVAGSAATNSGLKIPDSVTLVNIASNVEEPETPKSSAKVSLGEVQRRAGHSDGDVVCGLFWGGEG